MAMDNVLGGLENDDMIDASKILSDLLNPRNINMKTHITDPVTFAILQTVIDNLEGLLKDVEKTKLKLPITKKVLKDMIKNLKEMLVSWDRKSREETTETLKAVIQQQSGERSLLQKFLGTGKQ